MSDAITSILGLGPATELDLHRAGIMDAPSLRKMGADAAYERLLASGKHPHFIGYYALHMALQGRPWNDCKGAEKDALRKRFDDLCRNRTATEGLSPDLAKFMNEIGLIAT